MAESTSARSSQGEATKQAVSGRERTRQFAPGAEANILALQGAIGNRATSWLLQWGTSGPPHTVDQSELETASVLKIGTGRPLDSGARTFMEARFGQDFADVRVHSDDSAANTARTLQARALTLGRNILFARGEYQPATPEGRKLLAHELTHVIQQPSTTVSATNSLALSERNDHSEREAEATSEAVLTGPASIGHNAVIASHVHTPMVQRYESSEHVRLGDTTQAALSRMMGLLSSAETDLRSGRSAWDSLVLARDLWEARRGDPAALGLLEQATHDNDEGRYQDALRLLERAIPIVMAWVQAHPEAGGGRARTIAGREHTEIEGLMGSDAAQPLTLQRSGIQVTYGEVIALGDFYTSPEAMHQAPREELTNSQGRGILDLIRAETAGRAGVDFNQAYQEATEWRDVSRYDNLGERIGYASGQPGETSYASLARRNPEHFAVENRRTWEGHHQRAVTTADEARAAQSQPVRMERTNQAYTINAFGDHFLTDAFSAGHLLCKANYMVMAGEFWQRQSEEALDALTTALINDHWWAVAKLVGRKIPVPILGMLVGVVATAIAPGFVRNQIKNKIRELQRTNPDLILNAAVKVAHDYYSERGVEVQNNKGDRWRTFGDDHLKKSATTWQLASLAVVRSRTDVKESLSGPLQSDIFDAWGYTPIPPNRFDEDAFAEAREQMLRRNNNPLANLFIKNLPAIEHAEAQEGEAEERDQEANQRRNRYQAYLNYIRTNNHIEDRGDSDDVARDIVANTRVYGTLALREKAILVLEMLEGSTGDDDERAILTILADVQGRGQLRNLLQWVPVNRLKTDINGAERNELSVILGREGLPAD